MIDFKTQVESKAYFDKPYSELAKMRKAEIDELGYTNLPDIKETDTAILKNVVGILVDREFLQIYDVVNEMWDKERASQMDVNYFLHVWQIYATSPFANVILFVDSKAATEQPDTVNVKIVKKSINGERTKFVLSTERTAVSLTGGGFNLIQTDELANVKVMVTNTGVVQMPANAEDITLTGTIRKTKYVANTTLALTSNVGDIIVFNKA